MTRVGVTTDKVTVTNWFLASANRLDFVNFINREVTAAEIDTLVNGGGGFFPLGGSFAPAMAPSPTIDPAELRQDPGAKGPSRPWQPIKHFTAPDSSESQADVAFDSLFNQDYALAGKELLRRWQPIKNFEPSQTSPSSAAVLDRAVDSLVSAMASFGEERLTGDIAGAGESSFATQVVVAMMQSEQFRRAQQFNAEGRALID